MKYARMALQFKYSLLNVTMRAKLKNRPKIIPSFGGA